MEVKYIDFSRSKPSKSGKTRIWRVLAYYDKLSLCDSYSIGEVKWHGAWRRYALFPERDTRFEQDCLRKIANFCESQTGKLRKKWAIRRKARDHEGPGTGTD